MKDKITIKGARVHNLKNVNLELPRNKFIVFTGISGSGKSSLAFDTIFAEGQRRYVESLSAYARQFLGQMDKPDVDAIEGLSPAISIDQKTASHNPRSTVGTVTEIHDYLRLLFANIGIPHCPNCGDPIKKQSPQEILNNVLKLKKETKLMILAPLVRGQKGAHQNILEKAKKDGFSRVRVDGTIYRLDEPIKIEKNKKHTIEIIVDRISITDKNEARLFESIETALSEAKGLVIIEEVDSNFSKLYSENFACPKCDISIPEISPRLFSFNSPYGACPHCNGLGDIFDFDQDLVIEDVNLPVRLATQRCLNLDDTYYGQWLAEEAYNAGFTMETKIKDLDQDQKDLFLYGVDRGTGFDKKKYQNRWRNYKPRIWEGVIGNLKRRYLQTQSEHMRMFMRSFMSAKTCEICLGKRLKPEALSVLIYKKNIAEINQMSVTEVLNLFAILKLNEKEKAIAKQILKEINARLSFLHNVGLTYLTLDRKSNTLSGGESQRIRLATQIGSGLTGVLYVLDEPSIGLHQKDNKKLLKTLINLRDLGNTLIVVEHDEETIRTAEHIIDIGPFAGRDGGKIVHTGNLKDLLTKDTITAKYLNGKESIETPKNRRFCKKQQYLKLNGAQENNLKDINVKFPLGKFICITGVSGSGKSSLITDTLSRVLIKHFNKSKLRAGKHKEIQGLEHIDKVLTIDQSPIGRTPRSNPATYTGVFTPIRELFAQTREARIRGYKPGRFSFNVKGGRCEACQGDGLNKIEMHFLADVYITCDLCKGKRYNEQTLEVKFKGYSISDVLNMTINQAVEIFENIPQVITKLKTLQDVGLGYVHIGQSATTLSGGEAQRIKLSRELGKRSTGKTLYLLDEPTTGLHFADIKKLLAVLNRLVDSGNTVLVIEHNLDVIKCADHIIDLGPEGGDDGGYIIAEGTPEEVAKVKKSYTGEFLGRII